ncbi:pyridine nucleotide-disulfide oxidoreductase [Erythrobacter sp. HI00D59]|nr:pyridine nucleotide-disulfide oxidoreductase [Erythrobacter sp. HI00D59]
MRHIAIVGSGPAGYYTAEAAVKQWGEDARVDIFDKLPVPFGLIRTGVAPDHQSIKAVARRYEKTAIGDTVRFAGNVEIGCDIAIEELTELYDAVILATGAPRDRDLPIPGADSANVFGSAAFVGWYNGHPEYAALAPDLSGRHAVIIGMGNVALDVARILSKTEAEFEGSDVVAHALERLRDSNIETITILGRRGPYQIMMTPKELGELLRLERAVPRVENADLPPPESDDMLDPGQRKSVTLLREFAALSPSDRAGKALSINFDFFASPTLIEQEGGQLSGLVVERTELKDGRAVGSGETYRIPADLLISCIGYRTSPIVGVPFDERAGRFPNEEGRIAPALYCVGWAKRGPSGTIGTNRPDGFAVIEKVAKDIGEGAGKRGREGFDELAQKRALDVVTFRDWQRIEEAEIAAARSGAPREKFVDIESMIAARGA